MPQKGREHFNLTGFKCTNGYILMEKLSQLMSCDWCKKIGKDDPDGKFVKGIHLWNSSSTRGSWVNQHPYGERELEEEELSEYSEMESDYELEPEDK